jgi:hypothetical protein
MSEQEEAAWVAAIDDIESVGDLAIGTVNDRCPRCKGPLFVSGDRDYGVCLTHGEQFIGRPPSLEPPPPRSSARRMGWRLYP